MHNTHVYICAPASSKLWGVLEKCEEIFAHALHNGDFLLHVRHDGSTHGYIAYTHMRSARAYVRARASGGTRQYANMLSLAIVISYM